MKILVAPLDWGLGHATRTIPVIRAFLDRGFDVDLAVSGSESALYRGEFPSLPQIEIPGYAIRYPARGFEMPLWLLKNYGRLMYVIRSERNVAERLVRERGYDAVFSDNRFGFFSKKATNVYMTHQLRIAFPGPFSVFEGIGGAWHFRRMSKFDRVWVPDFPEFPGMAGKLSHPPRKPDVDYVGPLSRFSSLSASNGGQRKEFEFAAILSGPEPMRTAFEKKIVGVFGRIPGRHLVIRGRPGESGLPGVPSNVTFFNHLETSDFATAVRSSKTVVSRPGYSTVMDMAVLGASCVFVPTPGQTEQEYLGNMLSRSSQSGNIDQDKLNENTLCEVSTKRRKIAFPESTRGTLLSAVDRLIALIQEKKGVAE